MRMNRRNVLVGLGTIVAGGGAALGTGAFSSVKADRTVNVDVAGDSSALIGLSANDSQFVSNNDGELVIDLSQSQIGNETNATGVNTNARTVINNAFTVSNNSGKMVYIKIDNVPGGNITVSFEADGNDLDGESSVPLDEQYVEVPADASFDVNIEVNTDEATDASTIEDGTATVVAESSVNETGGTVSSP